MFIPISLPTNPAFLKNNYISSNKQTATSTYNPGISILIGDYLENLDNDNVMVRTNAARDLMVLAGSDIPEEQKTRMIYPLATTLCALLLRESPENLEMQRYLIQALLAILAGLPEFQEIIPSFDTGSRLQLAGLLLLVFESQNIDSPDDVVLYLSNLTEMDLPLDIRTRLVPLLIKALASENREVRTQAAAALGRLALTDISPDLKVTMLAPLIQTLGKSSYLPHILDTVPIWDILNLSTAASEDFSINLAAAPQALTNLLQSDIPVNEKINLIQNLNQVLQGGDQKAREDAANMLINLANTGLSPEIKVLLLEPLFLIQADATFCMRHHSFQAIIHLVASDIPESAKLKMLDNLLTIYENNGNYIDDERMAMIVSLASINLTPELKLRIIPPLIDAYNNIYSGCAIESAQALVAAARWELPEEIKINLLEPLLQLYEFEYENLKIEAARALTGFAGLNLTPDHADQIIEALLFVFADEDLQWRKKAAHALIIVAHQYAGAELVEPLLNIYEDASLDLQAEALPSLAYLAAVGDFPHDPNSKIRMIAPLTRAFRQNNLEIRKNAAVGLSNLARTNLPSEIKVTLAPMLLEAFEDPNLINLQREIAEVLVELMYLSLPSGQRVRMAEPLIMAFNNCEELEIKIRAVWALFSLAPLNILPEIKIKMVEPILTAATDPAFNMQRKALLALTELAGLNLPEDIKIRLIDLFIPKLQDELPEMRSSCAWALIALAASPLPAGLENRITNAISEALGAQQQNPFGFRMNNLIQVGELTEFINGLAAQLARETELEEQAQLVAEIEEKLIPFFISRSENSPYDPFDIAALEIVLQSWPDDIPLFDHLTTREARIAFVNYVISIKENSNEHEYVGGAVISNDYFTCHDFALQTYLNLTNGIVDISNLGSQFSQPSLPAKYRMPINIFSVINCSNAGTGGHAINAVLVGENINNLNDWYVFEPQEDRGFQNIESLMYYLRATLRVDETDYEFDIDAPIVIDGNNWDCDTSNGLHFYVKPGSEPIQLASRGQITILLYALHFERLHFVEILELDDGFYTTENFKAVFELGLREGLLEMDYLQNAVQAMQGGRRKRELTRFLRELASEAVDSAQPGQ